MLRTTLQFVAVAAVGLAVICVIGLFAMAAVASSHDVVRIPVPANAFLSDLAPTADYADAYSAPMNFSAYGTMEEVEKEVFEKGDKEIHRSDTELVYAGTAPGLTYNIGYSFGTDGHVRTLVVSTTVTIHGRTGKVYWTVVRPFHRMIVPFMLDRMVQAAPRR